MSRLVQVVLALAAVVIVAYVALSELEDRGYLELPRNEPVPETVAEAFSAVIGDQNPSCLESDVDVLAGYWRWWNQMTILDQVSVQRAGANAFINLLAQHRIALIDLAPTHGCTGVYVVLDEVSEKFIDYITAFRQDRGDEVENRAFAEFTSAISTAGETLRFAIESAPRAP